MQMDYSYCPSCGRLLKSDDLTPTYRELEAISETYRNQLMKYAHDLNKLYTSRRQLEQYLPAGLLEKVLLSGDQVVGERRYLIVLFSDIVGFTELSVNLDAEEVFLLMNNCFRLLVDQVYKFEGSVDKFVGDGMMALFGAPIAHENDPERAVRAALGMREAMDNFSQQMLPKLGRLLELRIGITSGDVIAGTVGVEGYFSYTVMGSTVNMASRLQSAASPGGILVNEDVYRHTRHLFNYRILSPIRVKGIDHPVPIFEVVSQISGPRTFQQLPGGQLSTFVGRQKELQQLIQVTQDTSQVTGSATFITGEAGLGKTRLIWEWQQQFPTELLVWSGFAQNFPQTGYEVWQQAILQGLNLQNAPRQEVVDVLLDYLGDETWLPFLEVLLFGEIPKVGHIGSLQPEQLHEQIFIAVRRLLGSIAQQHPLIILLDNLQWFDQLSRELLHSVLELSVSLPIVFCIGSRPEAKELPEIISRAEKLLGQHAFEISLTPLSTAESGKLLNQEFPLVDMPDTLRHYILERSQNNPYYLEELVSFIVNSGFVERHHAEWRIANAEGLANLSLPSTLRGLARAQIDRLTEAQQQLLSYAAVIGPTFSASLLLSVLDQLPHRTNVPSHLAESVKQAILAFDGTNYRFVHNIAHETMYQSLLSERRRQIHQQVGLAIEAGADEATSADIERLAYHFTAAENAQKAVPYLIEAGEKAAQRFANETALHHFSTALKMLPEAPQLACREPDIHKAMGDLYQHIGDYDHAMDHYHQALDRALNSDQCADYSRLIGQVWQQKGDATQARHWLEKALDEIARGRTEVSEAIRGRIYADIGLFYMRIGDYVHAERWSRDAVAILEQTEELSDLARSLNALGGAYYLQNRWHQAAQQVERAYEIQRQIGDQMGIVVSLNNLGILYTVDCEWDKAIDVFNQTMAMCEEMGALEMTLSHAHNNVAFIYLHQGQLDLAEGHLQQSLAIKHRVGTTLEVAESLNNLGLSRLMKGDYWEAETYLAESIELCNENNEQDPLSEATRYLAEIKLASGDEEAALKACQEAIILADQVGSKVAEGAALRILARIYLRKGEYRQAKHAVNASLRLLTEINHVYEIARTQVVIAEIAVAEKDEMTFQSAIEAAHSVLKKLGATPELNLLETLQDQLIVNQLG
jgi:adenylate cyclase